MSSGGARPGAGRKSRGELTRFMVNIKPEYVKRVKALAKEQNVTIGEALENIIDTALG